MSPRRTPNTKRRLQHKLDAAEDTFALARLAEKATYGGNPEHKRNPGDFGLQPPSQPRQGKSLCDRTEIYTRVEALKLVQEGLRRGLVSVQCRNGWPQNVWAVAANGIPVEAMLENSASGTYHAYPMLDDDPLADVVVDRWRQA